MSKEKSNLLDVIPCRAAHVLTEAEGEHTVLAFPRFKRAWMQRWLVPKGMSPYIRVRLEAHGTAVWQAIDGRATVAQLIEKLAVHFDNEANYESRIITYLYQLQKDGFITFLLPCRPC